MRIHIDPKDGLPIYEQIIRQLRHLLASGRLKPGDELPPIRALAEDLLVNPNTVARAYRELESAGLFDTRRGAGTRVSSRGTPLARHERTRILNERIDALLAESHQLGFEPDELQALLEKRARRNRRSGEDSDG